MQKLIDVRNSRGWTIQQTAKRAGVSWQSIDNLERSTTGPGDPPKTTIATVNALIEVFYPDLRLCDFVGTSNLEANPRDGDAWRAMLDKQSA